MRKVIILTAIVTLAGCGTFERADPSARSAKADYVFGNIQLDNGSSLTINLGDGAMAAADGEGAITQPTTTTTSVPTTFQTPAAIDPVTAGIQAVTSLASKGIDVYAARQQQAASAKPQDCTDGQCGEPMYNCPTCGEVK